MADAKFGGEPWKRIGLPIVGCGLGRRDWEKEVKPILSKYLDNRFFIIFPIKNKLNK